jgi:hypothetical protein
MTDKSSVPRLKCIVLTTSGNFMIPVQLLPGAHFHLHPLHAALTLAPRNPGERWVSAG